ncbi:MAG: hypothetical protein DRI61_16300 [Chloroflexi bacterium]|nr:MAG: hypothetical protein DRI61_16300 [Chloroflexota bacterium]
MKPIYFPFTYILQPVAETLNACFGKTTIYQPSSKHIPEELLKQVDQGILDIRVSGNLKKSDEKKLSAILKEYNAWADLHGRRGGIQLDFFKTRRNRIPFFDDLSTSQIKADIAGNNKVKEESDPVFNARIFLSIAQQYDLQHHKIFQDMISFETARTVLMENLKGSDKTSLATGHKDEFKAVSLTDYEYMIEKRIEAWTLLMCCDLIQSRETMSGPFVTSSRQTIDYLLEQTPEIENLFSINTIPMMENQVENPAKWSGDLMKYLEIVTKSATPLKCDNFNIVSDELKCKTKASLSLYLVPGTSPLEYFSRFVSFDSTCSKIKKVPVKFKNTLIGYIGFSG